MSDSHAFDIDTNKLAAYLEQHIADFAGPITANKFSDGQSNPTYLIESANGKYVLRRKPSGKILKSAHAVDREFRVMQALASTEVPVPEVYHLCEDDSVIGSMFFIMQFVDGRVLRDPSLPTVNKEQRADIYAEMISTLAKVHSVDINKTGLGDYGKPGNYFERQISIWTNQYRACETEAIPEMEKLIEWLPANMPSDDGQVSLVHGDFRLDNMMFHPTENRVIALVDWELSTLGHPYADLAYVITQSRVRHDSPAHGLGGLDRAELGIPTEDKLITQYCDLAGIDGIPNWNFYLAFSLFRSAAIIQGVKKRALAGNASSAHALKIAELVYPVSKLAVDAI